MHNPFYNPDRIRVVFLGGQYSLEIGNLACNVMIPCGENPATIVALMQANNVRHFDYDGSIATRADALQPFIDAAAAAGYEV